MNSINFVVSTLSIAISAMALGLNIAFTVFHKDRWARWCIVFQSCLLLTIFLGFADQVSYAFMSPALANVFSYIFKILQHLTIGFVCALLPYFLRWLIGARWGAVERAVFFTIGVLYFAAGLITKLVKTDISPYIQTPLFMSVLIYCVIMLWKDIKKVENPLGRKTCQAINIVTVCMIPTELAIEFFPKFKQIGFPSYVLAFSIILIIYFFSRFSADRGRVRGNIVLSEEFLSKYNVSGREVEVIRLICEGKTNKEIAGIFNISVNTVNNHVANIFSKMNINSRVDLVRLIKTSPWA